jgi:rubrerythrin
MNHFLLKFNHGVEIGARLAYLGHYKRTKDQGILAIADEELEHREALVQILKYYGEDTCKPIDSAFTAIGNTIHALCQVSPIFMLNFVARSMELFAVVNYSYLSKTYSDFPYTFAHMARAEQRHKQYFR